MELMGFPAVTSLPDEITLQVMWDIIKTEPLRVFLSWLLGGYILALVAWPVFYIIFYELIKGAKIARQKFKERSLLSKARKVQKQKAKKKT